MTTIFAFLLSSFIVLVSKIVQESLELSQDKCEELSERVCPACGSGHLIKNGSVHNGKPKHQCKSCGRQFVDNPTKTLVRQSLSFSKKLHNHIGAIWYFIHAYNAYNAELAEI